MSDKIERYRCEWTATPNDPCEVCPTKMKEGDPVYAIPDGTGEVDYCCAKCAAELCP